MLPDTRILTRHRDYCVLWEQQAIQLRDETHCAFHRVRRLGIDEMFTRAIRIGEHWFVFDLRSIHRKLALDIIEAPARDVDGTVLYRMREGYETVALLQAQVAKQHLDIWIADFDESSQLRFELGPVEKLDAGDVAAVKRVIAGNPDRFRAPYQRSAA